MRKKRPSNPDPMSVAYRGTPDGKRLQACCCQKPMPRGAIKADLSKQAPNTSYGPRRWYVDQNRNCQDCGKQFAWTAKKQQHWFEVLKIPIYVHALRCPACSRKVREIVVSQLRVPKEDYRSEGRFLEEFELAVGLERTHFQESTS